MRRGQIFIKLATKEIALEKRQIKDFLVVKFIEKKRK